MKPIKRVFISQPMSGLSNDEILSARRKATDYITSIYPDNEIVVIDSYQPQETTEYNAISAVNLLGQALSKMASAEIIYFAPGWKVSKGCQVENEVARRWLEPTGVKLIEDDMVEVNIELTDEELSKLKEKAFQAGLSINKYVSLKLQDAMQSGIADKIAAELGNKND